jgi:yeast amino acid transporter
MEDLLADCRNRGVPYYAVAMTAIITSLTYLSCGTGAAEAFIWLGNLSTLVAMLSWTTICITYVRFHAALKAQQVDTAELPFRSPFQPYLAWGCIVYFSILITFNGFYSFTPWNAQTFVSTYVGIP